MTGFEPIIAAATARLTGLITHIIIKDKGGKVLEGLDKNLAEPGQIKRAAQN